MKKDLSKIFNQFVGQGLLDPQRISHDLDMTLSRIEKAAKENGLELDFVFPGEKAKQTASPDHVNVQLEESANGRYKYIIKNISVG